MKQRKKECIESFGVTKLLRGVHICIEYGRFAGASYIGAPESIGFVKDIDQRLLSQVVLALATPPNLHTIGLSPEGRCAP